MVENVRQVQPTVPINDDTIKYAVFFDNETMKMEKETAKKWGPHFFTSSSLSSNSSS